MPSLSARHTSGWQIAGVRLTTSTFPQIDFERSDFDTKLAVKPFDIPVLPESAAYLDTDESEF